MKDAEKRKRVMQRSMRLGHCICDPKKPCPCDTLKERDVCLCAGERLDIPAGPVRLTRLVEKAGCASKIDRASLKSVLKGLPAINCPRVLVGMAAGDDAGVFQMDQGPALVQTVDVFSPSVDDPYTFGQVAAANSLSDVYAMGGRPICALSVVGFPIRTVPDSVMHDILRGGIDKMAEAGVPVIGGHSIKDDEIKAGFCVTGLVDPDKMMTNARAQPGDRLILTKPIGTGIIAFASQIDRAPAGSTEATARSMTTLNKTASERMLEFGAHACTDVTGFGLIGHLAEMAASSGVNVEIVFDDIPLFPGVLQCIGEGIIPGAVERNRESSAEAVKLCKKAHPAMLDICLDAQTSGGLLMAAPEATAWDLLRQLHEAGVPGAAVIGKVSSRGSGEIFLGTNGTRPISSPDPIATTKEPAMSAPEEEQPCCNPEPEEQCCQEGASPGHGIDSPMSDVSGVQEKFMDFIKGASAPGALDAATKQAVAIALSVLAKCEPCAKTHIRKARTMGFTDAEIDEAAWMAIAFGGSPTMMFYNAVRKN